MNPPGGEPTIFACFPGHPPTHGDAADDDTYNNIIYNIISGEVNMYIYILYTHTEYIRQ